MATTPNELDTALTQAKRRYDELDHQMRFASAEARVEWRALQARWTRFCAECDSEPPCPDDAGDQSVSSLRLVAEEFEKTFRRITEACR